MTDPNQEVDIENDRKAEDETEDEKGLSQETVADRTPISVGPHVTDRGQTPEVQEDQTQGLVEEVHRADQGVSAEIPKAHEAQGPHEAQTKATQLKGKCVSST